MADLFEVVQKISIEQIQTKYSTITPPTKGEFGTCPICGTGHDKTGHYRITDKGWYCHQRKIGGGAFSLCAILNNMDVNNKIAIAKKIAADFNLDFEIDDDSLANPEKKLKRQIFEALASLFVNQYKKRGLTYYQDRGLSDYVITNKKLGYCPKEFTYKGQPINFIDFVKVQFPEATQELLESMGILSSKGDCLFTDRYVMPYLDSYGRVIGWTGRTTDNHNSCKYINSKNTVEFFHKEKTLFNWYTAQGCNEVFVVEGTMDALSLIQAGVPGVVATSGLALTNYHLKMLEGKKIILALDNDTAGKDAMARLIKSHRNTNFIVCVLNNGYKDFNEFLQATGPEKVKGFVNNKNNRMFGVRFVVENFKETNSLSNDEGRAELYDTVAKLIGGYITEDGKIRFDQKRFPLNDTYDVQFINSMWKNVQRLFKKNIKNKGGNE
jgi:DNA primase